MTEGTTVVTVGHGTLAETELIELLTSAGVAHVVDVRRFPGSRRNPQYAREQLEHWLPAAGVAYSWDPRLGGRRRTDPASPHRALRDDAFRAYADHMTTADFHHALDDLVELAATTPLSVMCAESLWWRCHRRLLADALLLLRSVPVTHLFHDGRLAPHRPTPEARLSDGQLVYDLGVTAPLI